MTTDDSILTYPFAEPPVYGETLEVAQGVYWLRMPLPMSLKYINLYLLEGDKGWTIVDTGIRGDETRDYWNEIFETSLKGKPVTQIICTHMHPDHTGQAGFLSNRWRAPLLMSYSEYHQARVMTSLMQDDVSWQMTEYFERAGIDPNFLEKMRETRSQFAPEPEDLPLPGSFTRLTDGDQVQVGGHSWEVITGTGHSPEHVCLYNRKLKVLLSGDQVLPVITSNVSVMPTEPFGNPMLGWMHSHEKFRESIPNDTLVLPAHNDPFYGLHERLQQLIDHHEDRMLILEENCVEPQVAIDLLPFLFKRDLEEHSLFMGLGECIAHLHCLMSHSRIERTLVDNRYMYRSIDPTLTERARPGHHEEPDDAPIMV
ncbi:MAG: MBL fold metallo-hydrolase [Gammaproteobacteria bacterium]|jgi:glyoxylase-like metal-dependent hydrolase (beta-lactamase superfamily II)|nr:MBL fold metallo-hydrolase [Gammaproteobacteria bacterium]MBT4494229.1 MBL fold metallo-hydrolase [Gammaproteobacteria bacterium]MBT7370604.1 MBL fold metallo-hydrolase [Gammaproteobacteria bacterium]